MSGDPKDWIRYSGIGGQIAIYLLVFWWLGSKIESRYVDLKPWGTIGGLLFGVFAGMYELWKLIRK